MIKDLEKLAYEDLIKHFWNKAEGNFSFSQTEKISSPAIVAVCTMAIKNYENGSGDWIDSNRKKIEKYFLDTYPWKDAGKHYKNNMAMSFGFLGLKTIDSGQTKILKDTIDYLKSQQNDDGGWYFSQKLSEKSHPYFTYWALKCLLSLEPTESLWATVIARSYKYLIESVKAYYMNPTTYAMVRHILYLIYGVYGSIMDDESKSAYQNLHEYKVERFQNKDGTWKREPAVINSVYFRKSLFTLKNLFLLSERNYRVISDIYNNMITWVANNHLKPGWASDSEVGSVGVSWTTAYILLGLTDYRRAVRKYVG